MQLCIFEDINYLNFEPLVFSRPVYELVCGTNSLKSRILRLYNNPHVSLHCRSYLTDIVKRDNPGSEVNYISGNECLFINGRIIPPSDLSELLPLKPGEDSVFVNGDTVIAAYLSGENLERRKKGLSGLFSISDFTGLPVRTTQIKYFSYLWDLIYLNGKLIREDYEYFYHDSPGNKLIIPDASVHFVNQEQIFIGQNVTLKPGVVVDASGGPVIIDDDAYVYPNAVLIGPLYAGRSSVIKSGAHIYENVTIGKAGKVGGEVGQSVLMPFSNKQHSGFLGEAYLGSFVNIGAGTDCSDLKNNYSKIKVTLGGEEINSGLQFLGPMMGDHSKTAVGTTINTGTVAGFSCNILCQGFPDKYIPSFTWAGTGSYVPYDLHKAIDTARAVSARRKIIFDNIDEELFRVIFELTKGDREKRGY